MNKTVESHMCGVEAINLDDVISDLVLHKIGFLVSYCARKDVSTDHTKSFYLIM